MGGGWRYPTPRTPAPLPSQRRAEVTIRSAIEATVDLLERLPEERVTLDNIRRRSGVSQGSLTHHFGSRDALVAAAQVERFVRTCARDEQFLDEYGFRDGPVAPGRFLEGLITVVSAMTSPERHELRWMRMASVAAALDDEAVSATMSAAQTSLAERSARIIEAAQRAGIVDTEVPARTVALTMMTHARGLVLDDLIGREAPAEAWRNLQTRLFACFLAPAAREELVARERERFGQLWRAEVFGSPGRIPSAVADRLAVLRRRTADATPPDDRPEDDRDPAGIRRLLETAERARDIVGPRSLSRSDALRTQVITLAAAQLEAGGVAAIALTPIRATLGLSPQSFGRLIGDRETLVRRARVRVEIGRLARGLRRLGACVDTSPDAAAFRGALEAEAGRLLHGEPRRDLWQRFETLAATRSDAELRASLGRVQSAARDLLIETVCRAQGRGLIDAELPAREVARFLDGTVFWPVFHALDRERPSATEWTSTVRRIVLMLSPDGGPVHLSARPPAAPERHASA